MAINKYSGYTDVSGDPAPVTLQDSDGNAVGTSTSPLKSEDYQANEHLHEIVENTLEEIRQLIKIRS